nr:heavy metal translocating P-type ATPase [Pseudobdellovibrionaceae bacterium]
ILYLPILFYSAIPFYKGAWNSIKYRVINVDLPITVAMLTSVGFSTFNLLRGDPNIYFDSTASFMFLILSARYLLKRVQQTYLSSNHIRTQITSEQYTRIQNGSPQSCTSQEIKTQDLISLRNQQTLPCDGLLESSKALIDTSLFDGESLPKIYHQGMQLFAGTKCLTENTLIRAQKNFSESRLGKLLKSLRQEALLKTEFISLTDKLGQILIATVFITAAVFFFFYSQVDFTEAFNRSLALIVLACPCALALGSPLTFGLALKKAQELGILIKDGSILEKILKTKNLFFDKTGTLTTGELVLSATFPETLSLQEKQIILSLEKNSYHPIAFALRKAWPEVSADFTIESPEEKIGQGVQGFFQKDHFEIRSDISDLESEQQLISVFKNKIEIAKLTFKDELRTESFDVINELKSKKINLFLLPGDRALRSNSIAHKLGISSENVIYLASPEEKLRQISTHSNTCMIGDGANDSLALKKADIGIAVKGSVDISLQSCDAYFTRGGLLPLLELFQLAKQTRKTLYRNVTISLIYNSVGGTLALLGYINPMVAAILMPLSSVVIVVSSLWGQR